MLCLVSQPVTSFRCSSSFLFPVFVHLLIILLHLDRQECGSHASALLVSDAKNYFHRISFYTYNSGIILSNFFNSTNSNNFSSNYFKNLSALEEQNQNNTNERPVSCLFICCNFTHNIANEVFKDLYFLISLIYCIAKLLERVYNNRKFFINLYFKYFLMNAIRFMCCFKRYSLLSKKQTNQVKINKNKAKGCVEEESKTKQTASATTSTSTSTSKLVILRVLVLTLSMSSFSHASSTSSSHTNIKYGINTIKTKYGLLRGIVVRSSPLVEAYLGIPYASPPIGSLRFMPPITPSSWKNIRNADRFSPVCPQRVPMPPNGPEALLEVPRARLVQFRRLFPLLGNQSEDCLYLNVYIPKKSTIANKNQELYYKPERNSTMTSNQTAWVYEKLSTILFIHGESYEWNSGNPYDGSELAAHGNVIVVTINFRLGILGFLKTGGKESAQGNFGLMDLVAGLHWLKENLPAFGGDPNRITVMGHGTGAALANILLVSPVSSDLIQRAVLISGSALSPWAIQRSPLFVKRRVAEQTGCHGDLLYDDLAPCLRTKKLSELLSVKLDYPRFLTGFAPFVDGTVIAPKTDSFDALRIPLGSAIVSASGIEFANFPKQDLIFGLTSVESYLDLSAQDLEFGLNETRKDRILRTYVRNVFHYHLNEIFAVLKNEYTDWEKPTRNPFSSRDSTLSFLSDGHTASHLIKIGYMHSLRGGRSYFIHFKHKTEDEEYPLRTGSVRGEDMPFWLGLPVSPLFPQNYSSEERILSSTMVKYLSNFAKTGNPNQSSISLHKDNKTGENLFDVAVDHSIKKRPDVSNATNKNLETDSVALPKKRRRGLQTLPPLNADLSPTQRGQMKFRQKRSSSKFKRNMNKDSQGKNTKARSYTHKKYSSFGEMVRDDGDKKTNSLEDLTHWEVYDSVNQLYLELGNRAEIHSHYRGHKLSMWLNLIPQLHKHSNLNEMSMRHHQFLEDDLQFYDGIVRTQLQTKPLDDERDVSANAQEMENPSTAVQKESSAFAREETTTDCSFNATQLPILVSPTTFMNNSNTSDSFLNVLENMDVLRRLSGKELQSYTTALVATVAVGCFLLVLNVLIFAGIYHQREKRAKDAKKKEQLEENEIYVNTTPSKTVLSTSCLQTPSGKVSFGEYNCFDQKSVQQPEKSHSVDETEEKIIQGDNWVYSTNTIDLLNIKRANAATHDMTHAIAEEDRSLVPAYATEGPEMSYQAIENFINSKTKEDIVDESIPKPPPPPKAIHSNHAGILRMSGTNQINSTSKKRVHIQEISV